MYVRKKQNRSGSTSVVIVDKSSGKIRYLKTIGVSCDEKVISELYVQGKKWISARKGTHDIFAAYEQQREEKQITEYLLSAIENILLNGTQLILNEVFKIIGFDAIEDEILKQLSVARLCHPASKVATVDYLKSHFDEDVGLYRIYRYLDKLHDTRKSRIQQTGVRHTRKVLGGRIGLVFYDVTTLYFETDIGDEFRKQGYSKDGKHALPQVVLGLLVSEGGYPLAYAVHEGNKYEGHTMLPIVKDFVKEFDLKDFIIVADSGLMNNENIKLSEADNYKYIIGARIKTESAEIKQWALSLNKMDGCFYELGKLPKSRLIVSYSENRAKKDAYNRRKGITRLEKEYQSGTLTMDKINKRGYNKFLEVSDDISVIINYDKTEKDACRDGLKGYVTNTLLPANRIYEEYSGLWQAERAFRISKGTLELRPMFHFTRKRIEAHGCICFVAYKVYKELERVLKLRGINLSVDKALSISKTITTLKIKLPAGGEIVTKTMLITPKHKSTARLFDRNFWENF
jgi:transposase